MYWSQWMGRTIFITGTNRGIGKAILNEFCKEPDVTIFAHARKQTEEFMGFVASLNELHHCKVLPIFFDLSDPEGLELSLRSILKEQKQVDVLINNAGIMAQGNTFLMTNLTTMQDTFQVNFFSHVRITQLVVKAMIRNGGGTIVNMSSIAALDGTAGQFEYTCSKSAMIGMTLRLAKELAPYKIRCNAVAPGLIDTDMMGYLKDDERTALESKPYMGRFGSTEEVAATVTFLASDRSSYINGQVFLVDGGLGRFN